VNEPQLHESFKSDVLKNLPSNLPEDLEALWTTFSTLVMKSAHDNISKEEKEKKNSARWFNEEIKELIEKRRNSKTNPLKYKRINLEIKRKCQEAKENCLEAKCQEVENLCLNPYEMFKMIWKVSGNK